MNEVKVTVGGRSYDFQPESTITIGRSPDSDVIVDDPHVSREHARLRWDGRFWVLADVGRGRTFLGGQPVANTPVTQATDFRLGFPEGPAVRVEPFVTPDVSPPPTAEAPIAETRPGAGAPRTGTQAARGTGMMPGPDAVGGNVRTGTKDGDLATAWRLLVPIKSWINNPGWRQGLRLLVIPYALLPLIFIELYSNSADPAAPGKAYSVYIAPLWALAFWFLIRPGNITKQVVQAAIGISIWVYIWIQIVTIPINAHIGNPSSLPIAIGVGVNEETSKALPILIAAIILLKVRRTKWDARMWMFLGTISGLTFGVIEAWQYAATDVFVINRQPDLVISEILRFAFRVFVDGFEHAIWAGIAGFFIGMGINYSRRRVELIAFGIAIPALLHGLNDWTASMSSSQWPWICVNAFSLVLFLGYTMSAHSIDRSVRRSPIFRGESILVDDFSDSNVNDERP
jgi:RsiW-degrading membrane proteinase PrsW (M82 family)